MNNQILLSIIFPVYNVEKYLLDSLVPLLNQLENTMELIIINDGSTDGSLEIIKKKRNEYPNKNKIKLISQKNKGLSYSRNLGLKKSTGDYIMFFDSDDMIINDGMSKILNKIKKEEFDILSFSYSIIDESNKVVSRKVVGRGNNLKSIPNQLSNVWRYIVKRKVLIDNNITFRYGVLCEDIEWCTLLFSMENLKISLIKDSVYGYRVRENSIMRSNSFKRLKDVLINIDYSFQLSKKDLYLYNLIFKQFIYNLTTIKYLEKKEKEIIVQNLIFIFEKNFNKKSKRSLIFYISYKIFSIDFVLEVLHLIKQKKGKII